jgi:hypothetical protein
MSLLMRFVLLERKNFEFGVECVISVYRLATGASPTKIFFTGGVGSNTVFIYDGLINV